MPESNEGAIQVFVAGEGKYTATPPVGPTIKASLPQLGPWNSGLSFGGNHVIVAHAQLTLYGNGAYNFNGIFHNPDWVPYDVSLGWVVVDHSGSAFAFSTSGHVAGAITSGSQNYNWSNSGNSPAIAAAWPALEATWHYKCEGNINVDIGGLISEIVNDLKTAGVVITTIAAIVG